MNTGKQKVTVECLRELGDYINTINLNNGWDTCQPADWDKEPNGHKIGTHIALIHSEVSEALEGMRHNDKDNFAEELADTIIRVLDLGNGLGLDLGYEVFRKLEINKGRGKRHGGKVV